MLNRLSEKPKVDVGINPVATFKSTLPTSLKTRKKEIVETIKEAHVDNKVTGEEKKTLSVGKLNQSKSPVPLRSKISPP